MTQQGKPIAGILYILWTNRMLGLVPSAWRCRMEECRRDLHAPSQASFGSSTRMASPGKA